MHRDLHVSTSESAGSHPVAPGRSPAVVELVEVLRLAVPLALVHLGQVLLGAVDTAIVGRLGERELGAVGLGNSVYFVILVFGIGIMLGLDPLIAQAVGARETSRARRLLWQGIWTAFLVAVPLVLVVYLVGLQLEVFGVEGETAQPTREYLVARLPGFLPYLLFGGGRSYLQAIGRTRPLVVGAVLANVVNLPLSWMLVFGDAGLVRLGVGRLGVPALGVAGAAWTSTVCSLLQMLVVAEAIRRTKVVAEVGFRRPDRALLVRTLGLGAPIGLTLLSEVGVFAIINFLMANLDSRSLAGHQVAISFASLTFMVPLGIGAAASVRVGRAIGRRDPAGTRRASIVSVASGLAFMGAAAIAFRLVPRSLARVITDQPEVIAAAVPLLLVAAVFQISDGTQAVAAGALRGAGDTRFTLYANLGGHYGVGLPISVLLGFALGWGAVGLWWGLFAGLSAVAVALTIRLWVLTRRPIGRV